MQGYSTDMLKMLFFSFSQLTIKVSNVPPLPGLGLKCYIHGKERSTAVLSENELKCETPPEKDLPSITSDTGA